MINIVLYIATTVDGFIAKSDGNIEWLTSFPTPKFGDYGYSEFFNSIGTAIMGRKTYDKILNLSVDWPYSGINSYIVSSDENINIKTPNTYLISRDLMSFVVDLKEKATKDIWIIGGGQLISFFVNEDLIDKMILTVIPKILGNGIRLFSEIKHEMSLKLVKTNAFDTGAVNLIYEKLE